MGSELPVAFYELYFEKEIIVGATMCKSPVKVILIWRPTCIDREGLLRNFGEE